MLASGGSGGAGRPPARRRSHVRLPPGLCAPSTALHAREPSGSSTSSARTAPAADAVTRTSEPTAVCGAAIPRRAAAPPPGAATPVTPVPNCRAAPRYNSGHLGEASGPSACGARRALLYALRRDPVPEQRCVPAGAVRALARLCPRGRLVQLKLAQRLCATSTAASAREHKEHKRGSRSCPHLAGCTLGPHAAASRLA